jgi:hypothetical protein
MDFKTVTVCAYLMGTYWISTHFPYMNLIFYPTLGAFSFLFVSRPHTMKDLVRVAGGAVIVSIVGCLMFTVDQGIISFFLTSLLSVWLIRKFRWNAPPLLAVALIPFFAHPPSIWIIPICVSTSLAGLLLTLLMAEFVMVRVRQPRAAASLARTEAQ